MNKVFYIGDWAVNNITTMEELDKDFIAYGGTKEELDAIKQLKVGETYCNDDGYTWKRVE